MFVNIYILDFLVSLGLQVAHASDPRTQEAEAGGSPKFKASLGETGTRGGEKEEMNQLHLKFLRKRITWEIKAGRSLWFWGQLDLYRDFQGSQNFTEKPYLKTKQKTKANWGIPRKVIEILLLWMNYTLKFFKQSIRTLLWGWKYSPQQLKELEAPAQDLHLISHTHMRLVTTACDSSSRESNDLFCPPLALYTWCTYKQAYIHK